MPLSAMKTEGWTYADYLAWPEGERWELIDGQAWAMSPAPSTLHQRVSLRLAHLLYDALARRGCEIFAAPFDVRLPLGEESDDDITTVVQPDLVVICDPTRLDRRGLRGSPDWVIEILSPSSASHDCIRKLALYERVGVREYWIVHPEYRLVTVYDRGPDGRYGMPHSHDATERVVSSAVPGLEVGLGEVFEVLEAVSDTASTD